MKSQATRPSFRHARPAPRNAPGPPRRIHDEVTWTRTLGGPGEAPRELYLIRYLGSDNIETERTVELLKVGHILSPNGGQQQGYLGVNDLSDAGRFKTLRTDRVTAVLAQLTQGHAPSIRAYPTYRTRLPGFPVAGAVYKVPQTANPARFWTVDLNAWTCTCPERRQRTARGYKPGDLGFVCNHMAQAILDHLPATQVSGAEFPRNGIGGKGCAWTAELLIFISDPRRVHLDHLFEVKATSTFL